MICGRKNLEPDENPQQLIDNFLIKKELDFKEFGEDFLPQSRQTTLPRNEFGNASVT